MKFTNFENQLLDIMRSTTSMAIDPAEQIKGTEITNINYFTYFTFFFLTHSIITPDDTDRRFDGKFGIFFMLRKELWKAY